MDHEDDPTSTCLFNIEIHEGLKRKALCCIHERIEWLSQLSNAEVKQLVCNAKIEASKRNEAYHNVKDTPIQRKKAFIRELQAVKRNIKKTTNQEHGKDDFVHDIEQRVLDLQDALDAWPLNTGHWTPRKYNPKANPPVTQTLFDF